MEIICLRVFLLSVWITMMKEAESQGIRVGFYFVAEDRKICWNLNNDKISAGAKIVIEDDARDCCSLPVHFLLASNNITVRSESKTYCVQPEEGKKDGRVSLHNECLDQVSQYNNSTHQLKYNDRYVVLTKAKGGKIRMSQSAGLFPLYYESCKDTSASFKVSHQSKTTLDALLIQPSTAVAVSFMQAKSTIHHIIQPSEESRSLRSFRGIFTIKTSQAQSTSPAFSTSIPKDGIVTQKLTINSIYFQSMVSKSCSSLDCSAALKSSRYESLSKSSLGSLSASMRSTNSLLLTDPSIGSGGKSEHGNWGPWQSWSNCSNPCGQGMSTRKRQCDRPSQLISGKQCLGNQVEKNFCFDGPCSGLALSLPGLDCSDYCQGIGMLCSPLLTTGDTDKMFTVFGILCSSNSKIFWSKDWEPAVVNKDYCNGYIHVPSHSNCTISKAIPNNVQRICNCVQKGDIGFSNWSPWSSCSKTCNAGTQERKRACAIRYTRGDECSGNITEIRPCNAMRCPVNGGFSEWSPWGLCSRPCNIGSQNRTRSCSNPYPRYGGEECYGQDKQEQSCNVHECPVNGHWSSWTSWSHCDKPCNGGYYRRWRFCNNPSPLYKGINCVGRDEEAKSCNNHSCQAITLVFNDLKVDKAWHPDFGNSASSLFINFEKDLESNLRIMFSDSSFQDALQSLTLLKVRRGSLITAFEVTFSAIDSFQVLNLLDSMENELQIGKLRLKTSNFTINGLKSSSPMDKPSNLSIHMTTPTSLNISWNDMRNNGNQYNISGYIVYFRQKSPIDLPYVSRATNEANITINGLQPATTYGFRIVAYNTNGNGLATAEIVYKTMEKYPDQPVSNVTLQVLNGTAVFVQWKTLPSKYFNGVPRGYKLTYWSFGTLPKKNMTIPYSRNFATISNLNPQTQYVIEVRPENAAGTGPVRRVTGTTDKSYPTKSPPNVDAAGSYSDTEFTLRWKPIPFKYVHGDLKGYKIDCIENGNPFRQLTATPAKTQAIFRNLPAGRTFTVTIAAVNQYGVGKASKPVQVKTCSCPERLYSNFVQQKPYVYKGQNGVVKGVFKVILDDMVFNGCGKCNRSHGSNISRIDYVYNGKNNFAQKRDLWSMKIDIDDTLHLTFPVYGQRYLETKQGFPYLPMFDHPGVIFFAIKPSSEEQILASFKMLIGTLPILFITSLLVVLAGIAIWILDCRSNPDNFPISFTQGVMNGIYWAYITMGTHGYGDVVPISKAARLFTVAWTLSGIVCVAILIGGITSAFTISAFESKVKLYGTEVAAVEGSHEHRIGLLRNAKVNSKRNYANIDDVIRAMNRREVKGVLIDVYTAGARKDLISNEDIVIQKVINYPASFGVVLSGNIKNSVAQFKSTLLAKRQAIAEIVAQNTNTIKTSIQAYEVPNLLSPSSNLYKWSIIYSGTCLLLFLLFGLCYEIFRVKKDQRRDNRNLDFVRSRDILFDELDNMVKEGCLNLTRRVNKLCNDKINGYLSLYEAMQ